MSLDNLPVEWFETTFEKVISSISNGVGGKQNKEFIGIPVTRIETIAQAKIDFDKIGFIPEPDKKDVAKYKLNKGDILFSHINSPIHLGKTAIFQHDTVLYHGINLLRIVVDDRIINYKFFNYFCNLIRSEGVFSLNAQHAVNQSSINQKKLNSFKISLAPLAEQQEIVRQLDVMLAQVEQIKARLDAIPAILKKFRQSVLADAVSGKLTEEWRSQNTIEAVTYADIKNSHLETFINTERKNSTKKGLVVSDQKIISKYKPAETLIQDEFDLTLINQIPNNWTSTNLDNIAIIVTGKTPSTTDENNWNGEIPFISPSQILETGDLIKPERYVSNIGIQKVPIIPSGSILIVCIGTIGKVGLLKEDVAFNQQLNALIPTSIIRKEFLFMWCKTLHAWLNKTSSAVVNAAIINKSRLSMAPCPLPTLDEQDEIIRISNNLLGKADMIESVVNNAQKRVNLLTQSILAKAFSGELTAEWREQHQELITGVNSAESLLAKIQAQREASKPVKKTRAKKQA